MASTLNPALLNPRQFSRVMISPGVRSALVGSDMLWGWDQRWFRIGVTPFNDLTMCVNTPVLDCNLSDPIDAEVVRTGRRPDGSNRCSNGWQGNQEPRRCPHWDGTGNTYIGPTCNFGFWEVPCTDFGFLRYGIQIERSLLAQRLLQRLQATQDSATDWETAYSWAQETIAALKVFWHSTNVPITSRPVFMTRAKTQGIISKIETGVPSNTSLNGQGDNQYEHVFLYMPEVYYDRIGSVEGHYRDSFRGSPALGQSRDIYPRNVPPIPWTKADFLWGSGDRYRRLMNRTSSGNLDVLPEVIRRGTAQGYVEASPGWQWKQIPMSGLAASAHTVDQVIPENWMLKPEIAMRTAWAQTTYGQGALVTFQEGLFFGYRTEDVFGNGTGVNTSKATVTVLGFDGYLAYLKSELVAALSKNVLAWVTTSIEVYADELSTVAASLPAVASSADVAAMRRQITTFAASVAAARVAEISSYTALITGALTTIIGLVNAAAGVIAGLLAILINVIVPAFAQWFGQMGHAPFCPNLPFERIPSTSEDCPAQDTATFLAQLEGAFNAVQNGGTGTDTSSGTCTPPCSAGNTCVSGVCRSSTPQKSSIAGPVVVGASLLFLFSLLRR